MVTKVEKGGHTIILIATSMLAGFALGYAYFGITMHTQTPVKEVENSNGSGHTKPLPDFMIENIKPDELEQLKQ